MAETEKNTESTKKAQKAEKNAKKESKPSKPKSEKEQGAPSEKVPKAEKKTPSTFLGAKQVPLYLVALFLVAGLLGGAALYVLYFQSEPVEPGPGPIVQGKVNVLLLVDETCTLCANYNTILDVFAQNGIEYEVKEVSINSPDGAKAVSTYNVKIIPSAIIPINQVTHSEIKPAMEQSYAKVNGNFVVPELNLNQTKIYPRKYLVPPVEEDCNADDGRITVQILDSPFHEISIGSKNALYDSIGKFSESDKNSIDVLFGYLPTKNNIFEDANKTTFNQNIGYLVCSSFQGKFLEVDKGFFGHYCDADKDPKNLTSEEIDFCKISPHYGRLLSFEELQDVQTRAGLDGFQLAACMNLIEAANNTSLLLARDYSIIIPTTAIVECKYNVPFKAIDEAICLVNPELDGCKAS